MTMVKAEELARSGCKYIGTPYSEMDCQALWEKMLQDCGLKMNLGGSNSWYRYIKDHGWVGTPEECKKVFGCIPEGATLFIREDVSATTPEQFRHDGIGDITHMGGYTGMTGKEMCEIAEEAGVKNAKQYNFGNGAIHSSHNRGEVCTSTFRGETIKNGGWNRIGLFLEKIYYKEITPTPEPQPEPDPDPPFDPQTAIVESEDGNPVKMRAEPNDSCRLWWKIPIGTVVIVDNWSVKKDKKGNEWAAITWGSQEGYMINKFLRRTDYTDQTTYVVIIPNLTKAQAEELKSKWPGTMIEEGRG
jgi:hypothetical protein